MKHKNISAFTPPGSSYPPFISINETDEGISFIVRSPRKESGECGDTAYITLSEQQALSLALDIMVALSHNSSEQ